ncbi:tyrosine-type recombinase/integrase [Mitsuaria sp. WAJ17]|uniref:tyrosine-type recombinase/integrase n=1 Tax=Mitsuaria sp. WAJ17 TaxID=2761452 RepID=UPI0015FFC304|nr:integrase arm-type DNA-binding domain-containing protein [Mitsuaria sp. WAJ17]MBB2485436.1 tyrosine-type recombinase/integrase [Mitsuaria sp. WAJ17]
MRHINYTLKPAQIDNAKPAEKPYALTDGGGLIIEILPGGSKTWRYKYHLLGKREKVTIGAYPAIGIKAARDKHEELRALVEAGQSPAKAKQAQAVESRQAAERATAFRVFAQRWIDETLFYRSPTYRAQIVRWLDSYVYPEIGDMELGEVMPAHVLSILEKRLDTPTTADRVRVIIQQIYNFAIRKLLVTTNPATPLRGAVVVPPKTHAPHLTAKQLGEFWRVVDKQGGAHASTILASKLLCLTMVRKMELLRAKKAEFDLEAGVWDIPAERMKMKRVHRVMLSSQALELVRMLVHFSSGSDYLVPSIFRRETHMSEVTLNHFFKRMDFGVPRFSPHGFRGTAATVLREHGFGRDVVELLLAHAERDATVAAYSHVELNPERRRAMQFWADFVDRAAAGAEVIVLRA